MKIIRVEAFTIESDLSKINSFEVRFAMTETRITKKLLSKELESYFELNGKYERLMQPHDFYIQEIRRIESNNNLTEGTAYIKNLFNIN
jgi:hypothetical protein